ncbi:extracellular solute-binding protein [Streptomyces hainanensis]|uniref:Carbohydrate ABC transporter substrate-binding protein n=1 Tax=Streptomyces hainanensis TaxID=402648 RepID=A0A4R4SQT4_9ACTN|nr:ABC transporter substrate-binding protein [Streptomyces hainanensis]TDC66308.1 carbohydrate ABC transporter substrate-binding protein [Streptomyces hainanensis]
MGVTGVLAVSLLAACSSDSDDDSDGQITLRVGVFGQFGFEEAGLYDEYMELNPDITIEQDSVTELADYIAQLRTRLGQNSGLADIQAIEVGNIAEMTNELSDAWVDFNEYENVDPSHFMPFKVGQATDPDGRLIGLGTDIGPTGVCYRTDYFEAAGLPTDPEEVGALFADWESYLDVGEQFQADGPEGISWTDSAPGLFNAVVSGYEERYTNAAGETVYQESQGVSDAWDLAVEASERGLTNQQQQFTDDWNRAIANGAFATFSACPSWMLGHIAAQAGDEGQGLWNVAASPTPSNWGGSFIGVPEAGEHRDAAVELAAWLTAPEQQARLFSERGSYPSSAEAQQLPEVLNATNPYFGDAPIGQFFSAAAAEIPSSPIGPNDQVIQDSISQGLVQIDAQGESPESAWESVVSSLDNALAE